MIRLIGIFGFELTRKSFAVNKPNWIMDCVSGTGYLVLILGSSLTCFFRQEDG